MRKLTNISVRGNKSLHVKTGSWPDFAAVHGAKPSTEDRCKPITFPLGKSLDFLHGNSFARVVAMVMDASGFNS